jgi:hypothetical protein
MEFPYVFVQLGMNASPQLYCMAKAAKKLNSSAHMFLITDNPKLWQEFPGSIIEYRKSNRRRFILDLAKKNKHLEEIAGGYWFFTFERLFALESIYSMIESDQSFLHFESDVLPMILEEDLKLFNDKEIGTAVPRYSQTRGIASVLFSQSQGDFDRFLHKISEYLSKDSRTINDMDLLGLALNDGTIDELPTAPIDAWRGADGRGLIFDGAAIGQYLFGQDPFHTFGRRISGFINPDYHQNIEGWKWEINSDAPEKPVLLAVVKNMELRVLNLHIHSKIALNEPNFSEDWVRALEEANGIIPREYGNYTPNYIHTSRVSLRNRIRLARKKGFLRSLLKHARKKLRNNGTMGIFNV